MRNLARLTAAVGAGLALLAAGGCGSSTECGSGAHLEKNRCVPDDTCGAGTHAQDGECVPDSTTTCGPGTVKQTDGSCTPAAAPITCGEGTVLRNDVCVDTQVQHLLLPFPAGTSVKVSQSSDGFFSHNGTEYYAVDFPVPVGTTFVAARGGRVWDVKQDSNIGCADQPCATPDISQCKDDPCASDANYIVIDHGDGTLARYFHMEHQGALVQPGDTVCQGQPIGLSGNTGYSSGPHVHIEVDDLYRNSLPLEFAEVPSAVSGEAFEGATFTSQNTTPDGCRETHDYSSCPTDLFGSFGVSLDPGQPCTVIPGSTFTLTGASASASWTQAMLSTRALATTSDPNPVWQHRCFDVGENGRFSVSASLQGQTAVSFWYFRVSVANNDCQDYAGAFESPKLRVGGP